MRFSAISAFTALLATTATAAPTRRALDLDVTLNPALQIVDNLTGKLGLDLNVAALPDTLLNGVPLLSDVDLTLAKIKQLLDCILDQLNTDIGVSVLSSEATTPIERTTVLGLDLGLDLSGTPLAELLDAITAKLGVSVDLSVLPNGLSDLSNVSLEGIQACLAGTPASIALATSTPVIHMTHTPTATPIVNVPVVPEPTSTGVEVPTVVPTAEPVPTKHTGCVARY
ncbi:hypothetical protein BJX70DRAFT_357308 [Aspergillus crustosus]